MFHDQDLILQDGLGPYAEPHYKWSGPWGPFVNGLCSSVWGYFTLRSGVLTLVITGSWAHFV